MNKEQDISGLRFIVTGGAGFIGTSFTRMLLDRGARVKVLDALTYAGNPANLRDVLAPEDFVRGDIGDAVLVKRLLEDFNPHYIVNFAAESHVDRSVTDPAPFVTTNIVGTQTLLETVRRHIGENPGNSFRKFVQISTDEVYGDLEADFAEPVMADGETCRLLGRPALLYGEGSFSEESPLRPSSPYSASKTSADLMALAYARTFGLPVVITRCSNNYGPWQFPEKLIPLMVNNLLEHRQLPVYGRGLNVRDWIHVDDHCAGVLAAALSGRPGEVYNFGGYSEKRNIDIVRELIRTVAEITGDTAIDESLISYVKDRPGHDRRYAIDARKAMLELGWRPQVGFAEGLADTVRWYLDNRRWVSDIVGGQYREYYKQMYSDR